MSFEYLGIHDLQKPKPLYLKLTETELQVINVLEGAPGTNEPGGFTKALIEAMTHMDPQNAQKLRTVYPALVEAVLDYKFGNLHARYKAQKK